MRGLALIALCGCNQVFGLNSTSVNDAPPPDGAFACPPLGQTPTFTLMPVDVLSGTQSCSDYITSERSDFALADCCPIRQGTPDHALGDATFANTTNSGCTMWSHPRLVPEGNGAIFLNQSSEFDFLSYDGVSWGNPQTLSGIAVGTYDSVGAPSRWSQSPHVLARSAVDGSFDEFVCNSGTCSVMQHISTATLGITSVSTIGGASLTADGLRMVFFGISSSKANIYYTDRSSILSAFGMATAIKVPAAPPQMVNPFLTEDCGTLFYVDSDGSIWATHQ